MPTAPHSPIQQEDIHAWVDERLSPEHARALEEHFSHHPAQYEEALQWRAQAQALRALHADAMDEPVPAHLLEGARQLGTKRQALGQWTRWGGMAACVALAFACGWWLRPALLPISENARAPFTLDRAFVQQASTAHMVYAPEVRHPVEVSGAEQDHLVQWLSKRLGRPLRVPDLQAQGYVLMGGRLLPGDTGARAQFMFQNAGGTRITLYVGGVTDKVPKDVQDTVFQFSSQGHNRSFYWVDRGFGYALTGALDRGSLMTLSEAVYSQLTTP